MKAKEYAAQYLENPTIENLRVIVLEMWEEAQSLVISRKVTTQEGEFAIIDEQYYKWKAFLRHLGPAGENFREDFFIILIREVSPEIYEEYQKYKWDKRLRHDWFKNS